MSRKIVAVLLVVSMVLIGVLAPGCATTDKIIKIANPTFDPERHQGFILSPYWKKEIENIMSRWTS